MPNEKKHTVALIETLTDGDTMTDIDKLVAELRALHEKATPPGQWQAGRSDMTWYNMAGEQQASIYHATEADGIHIGQPLPLRIATFGTGNLALADPQAHAELTAAAVNALPDLLSTIEAQRTRIAELEAALKITRKQIHVRMAGKDALSNEKHLEIVERALGTKDAG